MSDLKAYLEYKKDIDLIFDYHNNSEDKMVKITVLEFTDYIIIWWNQVVICRRNCEKPIEKLKAIMGKWFVPNYYYKELHKNCKASIKVLGV